MLVDPGARTGYTSIVTTDQPKRRGAKKKRKPAPQKTPWGSLAAAIAAVAMLGALIYGSFRAEGPKVTADTTPPATPPAVTTTPPPAAPPPAQAAKPAAGGESWNDAQIAWQSYEAGMAKAKAENKPVCLVFYTNWCPHCRNYSRVFQDARIVARARDFVMIRVNPDDESAVGDRYAPDGTYVPRTFFLDPNGTVLADVHASRPKFIHFYDENDPTSLLGGMDAALRKLARPM